MRQWAALVVATTSVTSCGGSASPRHLSGTAAAYVLTIDQVRDAGFITIEPVAATGAAQLVVDDELRAHQLEGAGLRDAARVRYFRTVTDLRSTNGPVDITATVAFFEDEPTASHALSLTVASIEAKTGEQAVSTGDLGDEAHADQITAADDSGTSLVQFTVQWRIANVLNQLTIRGRAGGTRIADALRLAHRQLDNEFARQTPLSTPTPLATATPSRDPHPAGTPTPR